jgi:siroheme decarboxylase NirDL-like protein
MIPLATWSRDLAARLRRQVLYTGTKSATVTPQQVKLTSRDKQLIEYLSNNFPVVSRPFEVVAEHFDMDELTLLEWVTELVVAGAIKSLKPTLDLEVKEE